MNAARLAATGEDACTVLHVAVGEMPVQVELLRRPELVGTAVAVTGGRGVVVSATAPARRCGVHPGVALSRARRLCPPLTVLTGRPVQVERTWAGVLELLRSLVPVVEPLGTGTALLDASGTARHGGPVVLARRVRDRVADEQGLTCSVGVAGTRLVAGLAAAAAAPDGLLVVPAARVVAFLHPLPAADMPGVGRRTARLLEHLGLRTVADVAHAPAATLTRALGQVTGRWLHEAAWGRDDRPVTAPASRRAVTARAGFARDVDDPALVHRELLRLAVRVAARARATGVAGRTVVLEVRFADGTGLVRSRTLPERTDATRAVLAAASALLDGLGLQRARLRGAAVRLEDLAPSALQPRQLLLGERTPGWREVDGAVDRAGLRFGAGSVRPATLLETSPDWFPAAGTPAGGSVVGTVEDWSPPDALPGGPGWWAVC
ncbi:DNA polymerase IV [Kineococcus sp. TRM81007]|uniref:DNA polymerase Y family protein n=1 Tax=Kineococcus sp. TRM81007 TaxID=2925831 RepID=UPI001F58B0D8|nr:DNA polymerase IV [Kineococcus sp. TRM81007]MCI2239691.1 DNA polymerase IV [Kineococcus sp. TRM81007]